MTEDILTALVQQLGAVTKDHVVRVFSELSAQMAGFVVHLKAIEERLSTVKDGEQGIQGAQGPQGERGAQGEQGIPGRDGLPGVPGHDGAKGIDGQHGQDGKNGLDGFGFDDFEIVEDAKGRQTARFIKGDRVKEFRLNGLTDQGPWRADDDYMKGDVVSFGGSSWIARKDNQTRPGTDPTAWRLSVKCGRDGKDGKQGPEGKQGRDGRDLV